MSHALHVGLIINPLAGLGGSLALKGSDGDQVRDIVAQLAPEQRHRSLERTLRALRKLAASSSPFRITCWAGEMGELALQQLALDYQVLGDIDGGLTSANDTRLAATQLLAAGVDLILFSGGDGTARDVHDAIGNRCPVLGIPAGVKMHSGVFAVSPEAAGDLLRQLAEGGLVGLRAQEVRDIDEQAFRQDVVRSSFYGELMVPGEGQFLQHTKVGGREDPQLAASEIAAWVVDTMAPELTYLIGPGSTTAAIMAALNLPNTLLGVDVVRDGQLIASDANEQSLLALFAAQSIAARIVVTPIGGQGHIFGRGNQQFSPAVIRAVGFDNIIIVAAKAKIAGLEGRALLVDTNDTTLDLQLCSLRTIITGYEDQLLYRVSTI